MTYKLALNQYADFDDYVSALNANGFRDNERDKENPVFINEDGEITAIRTWHNGDGGVACVIERLSSWGELVEEVSFYTYKGKPNNHNEIDNAPTDYTPHINELIENGIIEVEEWKK
jgi:hypothetical protein